MAFTITTAGTQGNAGPSSSLVLASVTRSVGTLLVVCVAAANSGTSGVAITTTCADSAGNTYTQRTQVNRTQAGAADDGITLTIFTAILTVALSSGSITVSFSPSSAQGCAMLVRSFAPGAGETASYVTAGAGATGRSTTPSITSGSITSGDIIVGALASETSAAITDDTDTTDGSWSAKANRDAGSGAAAGNIVEQEKTVTATGTQTFDPTIPTTQDWAINYIVIHNEPPVVTYSPYNPWPLMAPLLAQ